MSPIGSTIIFADKDAAKRKVLLIDTIFCVGAVHVWKRGCPPRSLRAALATAGQYKQAYIRHLRFGIPKGSNHAGSYTYAAATLDDGGRGGSFIPLDSTGNRVEVKFSELSLGLQRKLSRQLKHRLPPIILDESEVREVLRATWKQTDCAVTQLREIGALNSDKTGAVCGSRRRHGCAG